MKILEIRNFLTNLKRVETFRHTLDLIQQLPFLLVRINEVGNFMPKIISCESLPIAVPFSQCLLSCWYIFLDCYSFWTNHVVRMYYVLCSGRNNIWKFNLSSWIPWSARASQIYQVKAWPHESVNYKQCIFVNQPKLH